jgi:hypothetical protein
MKEATLKYVHFYKNKSFSEVFEHSSLGIVNVTDAFINQNSINS